MRWVSSNDRDELVAAVVNELEQHSEIPEYWVVPDESGVDETVILFGESLGGFTPNIIVSWNTGGGDFQGSPTVLPPITVCEHDEVVGGSDRSWRLNVFLADQDYYIEELLSVGDSKGLRTIRFNSNAHGRQLMRRIVDIFAAQALPEQEERHGD